MISRITKTSFFLIAAILLIQHAIKGQTPDPTPTPQQSQAAPAQPAVAEWGDNFEGDHLDSSKWEPYTFEGGGGGKIEVKDSQLRMRGLGESRAGIRTKQTFHGDRFYVGATVAKVGGQLPQPGQASYQPGYAIITVLFGGNATNRIEWIFRSDGLFEAWVTIDGRSERLDNQKLGTKEKMPHIGIARRGDEIFFMLNKEVGLQKTIRGLPTDFKVMLYGFGSTENNWDEVYVQTLKQ